MASMRFKPPQAKTPSGIFKSAQLPTLLQYPQLLPFSTGATVKDIFCYVVKHYGVSGLSCLIYRQPDKDQLIVLFGDWNGNNIDIHTNKPNPLTEAANKFVTDDLHKFINMMHSIRLQQAQLFFAVDDEGLILVDIQLSLNKFASPGMVRDIFGKIHRTQEVKKIEIIDDRAIEYIDKGVGSYEHDLIIKPSRFRMYHDADENTYQPMYVEVRR